MTSRTKFRGILASGLCLASLGAISPRAHAQGTVATTVTTTEADTSRVEYTRPNTLAVRSGAMTLAVSYAAALIVAIESDRASDDKLYIPVAGPWLDFADRGNCGVVACRHETVYKTLLVVDGVLQGLGALQIIAGLIIPEEHVVTTTTQARSRDSGGLAWHAAPMLGHDHYGARVALTF